MASALSRRRWSSGVAHSTQRCAFPLSRCLLTLSVAGPADRGSIRAGRDAPQAHDVRVSLFSLWLSQSQWLSLSWALSCSWLSSSSLSQQQLQLWLSLWLWLSLSL